MIFVGPSISREALTKVLPEAEFRGPVERGDIDVLLREDTSPDIIGIIDGKFLHAMSISPKEILTALNRGVTILGSSSMGALRAAELDTLGMTGIGTIYQWYADGTIDADDEVAITFDPKSLRALCTPMVNFRASVNELVGQGSVTEEEGGRIVETAKAMYFPDRTHASVCEQLVFDGVESQRAEELFRLLEGSIDRKATDALLLARRVSELTAEREVVA
ncbi:TfuA-like protein [Kocuria tytonicola]|uniref:TfuA-like protein n=1 Tax=Kocuria tytonicola TaxID=2055946 RepID=UPI001401C648|nr:TfuA-like protein [Kocuria tytonicola]